MANSAEKLSLAEDFEKQLQECGQKGTLIAHLKLEGHRLLGWNEVLRRTVKGRLGQKAAEKRAIQKGRDFSFSSSPSGLDLSTHQTAASSISKMLSSKKA